MSKKELEITLKKNLLDLEYNRYFGLFSTCIILSTTVIGLSFSAIPLWGISVQSGLGLAILGIGIVTGMFFLILAYNYRRKYQACFRQIESLLDEVRDKN